MPTPLKAAEDNADAGRGLEQGIGSREFMTGHQGGNRCRQGGPNTADATAWTNTMIQPLDTEGIHRQEAGQHTQHDRTNQIATDQQEFLGTRSTITPMNGPNKMGGRVCSSPIIVVLRGSR